MKAARHFVALAIVAIASVSCRTLPFPDPHLEGDYGKALKRWTRTVAIYNGLETRAFARMIYLSPEFVVAQAQEISRMRAELPDQAAETLAHLREQYKQPSFFAIAYIPDKTGNDWNEPNSVWRIALNLGEGERKPEHVVRYEKPFDAELRAIYPYLDDYSTGYLIKFPVPLGTAQETVATTAQVAPQGPIEKFMPGEMHVVVAGALGKLSFNWRLSGSAAETPSTGEGVEEEKPASAPRP